MSSGPLPSAEDSAPSGLAGKRTVVMGLGSFGGGVAAVRWLLARGARVTVTDLRREEGLGPALEALDGCPVSWSLGEHRERDFAGARWVVVNPAVRPDDPWLARAREAGAGITSEVGLFLARAPGPVVLVSGTQGKSSTANATGVASGSRNAARSSSLSRGARRARRRCGSPATRSSSDGSRPKGRKRAWSCAKAGA